MKINGRNEEFGTLLKKKKKEEAPTHMRNRKKNNRFQNLIYHNRRG